MNIPINYQNETGKKFTSAKVIKIEKPPIESLYAPNVWRLHVETISEYQPTFMMEEEKMDAEYPEWRELIVK
jgi:hypothetical protein